MKAYHLEKSLLGGEKFPIYYTPELNGGGLFWCNQLTRKKYSLPKVNSVMEMGCGPGFMGFYIKYHQNLKKLVLIDIYEPVTEVINKTIEECGWEDEVELYISDGLNDYTGDKVDMIVSNPPHLTSHEDFEHFKNEQIGASKRILLDDGLSLHKNFLQNLNDVLNPNGYVFLLENKIAIPPETILEINPKLKIIDYIDHSPNMVYSALYQLT